MGVTQEPAFKLYIVIWQAYNCQGELKEFVAAVLLVKYIRYSLDGQQ